MQVASEGGKCVYCGKMLGLILPFTNKGVIVAKDGKTIGVAHNECYAKQKEEAHSGTKRQD